MKGDPKILPESVGRAHDKNSFQNKLNYRTWEQNNNQWKNNFWRQTLIIPPKERERQCFLLKGARESAEGVSKGCFSNYKKKTHLWKVATLCERSSFHGCSDLQYLSDEFLLFGRLGHVVDLLVQLSESKFGITLSFRRCGGAGAADLTFRCSHWGRRRRSCYGRHGPFVFSTITECWVILEDMMRYLGLIIDWNNPGVMQCHKKMRTCVLLNNL